jgi:drug/metabolite transporter (DMT)-like permease
VTALWGTTFPVIKGALDDVSPSVLLLVRFGMAGLLMTPFLRLDFPSLRAGSELGFWLFAGYATQTVGLQYTTAGRSAFITALSVILVPIFLALRGRRLTAGQWCAAGLAFVGVGLLSYDGSPPNLGDAWTLGTAVAYALYMIRLERFARLFPIFRLVAVQLWGVVALSVVWVALDSTSGMVVEGMPWAELIYLAVFGTVVTVCLATLGQRYVGAETAAVVFSLEPVWGAGFAYLLLGEVLHLRGLVGGALVVLAMVALEVWSRRENAALDVTSGGG